MKNRLWTMMLVFSSFLMLTACQNSMQNPTSTNQIGQLVDIPVATVSVDSDGDGVNDELDMCPNTQQSAVVDYRGCHFTTGPEIGLKMEIRIFFAQGSSDLLPKYQPELDLIAEKLHEFDTATMLVNGNIAENEIDGNSLTAKSNTLAKNRAMIVKSYLITQHQIAPERITTFDCSARAPIAPNDTQEHRHMNRRVYGLVTRSDEDIYKTYQKYSKTDQCVEFKQDYHYR